MIMPNTAKTMTAPEMAAAIGAAPKIFRSYLRSADSGIESVGKGKRYALPGTKTAIAQHTKQFAAWQAKQDAARTAREAALTAAAPLDEAAQAAAEDEYEAAMEAEALGETDELEPTAEELDEIEIIDSNAAHPTI